MIALTLLGLLWVLELETRRRGNPVWPVGLLIIGSNGIIAILLPYASESYPIKIRGRATGWVAAETRRTVRHQSPDLECRQLDVLADDRRDPNRAKPIPARKMVRRFLR